MNSYNKLPLSAEQQLKLLAIAKESISRGLPNKNNDLNLSFEKDSVLNKQGACFVTLTHNNQLRGCIGSLMAYRSLIEDVAGNAYSAAFKDPRFSPLQEEEADSLHIEISVLSEPKSIPEIHSFDDLLNELQPFKDGLILSQGYKRSTFLPSVWEQLPDKESFIRHLMHKGTMTRWDDPELGRIQCERYTTYQFGLAWRDISDLSESEETL